MLIDDLVKNPGVWLSTDSEPGIVISHRIRLARNVCDVPFPEWARKQQRRELRERLFAVLRDVPTFQGGLFLAMEDLSPLDREVLRERHLISYDLAEEEKGRSGGVAVAPDEQIAVMINEEDHLRIQGIGPGMDPTRVWQRLRALDEEIEQRVEYAFSATLGYLTACPSNVGTGLRISLMMHLPGLRIMDDIMPATKGLEKLGLAVRGLNGEGTDAAGNMCQISNQSTLGESEEEIMLRIAEIGREFVGHERNARGRVTESRRARLLDHVGRAFGILRHATLLSFQEAVELLSALRLGVELGLIQRLPVGRINEVMLLTQPAHLQKIAGAEKSPEERDEIRAAMTRRLLGSAVLKGSRFRAAAPRATRQTRKKA
jgi:protein arginine kinase